MADLLQGKKAVIFDMDGTLIDSVGIWNQVDAALIRQLGGPQLSEQAVLRQRDDLLRRYSHRPQPYLDYCWQLGALCHSPLSARQIHDLRYQIAGDFLVSQVDYKPGVPLFLAQLRQRGLLLAIATTTKKTNMDIYRTKNKNLLAKAPLDSTFTVIYTREDAAQLKPHPQIYQKAVAGLGLAPADCLVLEDSLIGVQAAKAAGLQVAAIADRYAQHEAEQIAALADWQFGDYFQLLAAIRDSAPRGELPPCIRPLTAAMLRPGLFAGFSRRQLVTDCWRREAGHWAVRRCPFIDQWSPSDYGYLVQCLQGTLPGGGAVYGAFIGGRLAGFCSVEGPLTGSRSQFSDLTSLHVSQDRRGRGIGRQLFAQAAAFARTRGAEALYISAHSAVETQAFYRAMGCVPATEELACHTGPEPFDCQLQYAL
ncbi:HAD-IA family hydrolase [Neobittarella massiliensis]|nr:HAD-IA family hydrolase [Neobittarella massiliensis]